MQHHLADVGEILPTPLLSSRGLLPIQDAIRGVHFPRTSVELQDALRRLKYEEFFQFQTKLALKRYWRKEDTVGIAFAVKSKLARQLVDALPFTLTGAQVRVVREITADMEASRPMNRLLQGDVGSGKTVVALIAMLIAWRTPFCAHG
jgi:ATP-dependent DNA helicase RecG